MRERERERGCVCVRKIWAEKETVKERRQAGERKREDIGKEQKEEIVKYICVYE